MLRPTLVNQFQILVGHEREPTSSVLRARHRRGRRVYRRRRAGRSHAHRDAPAARGEPDLDERTPRRPGGIPAARLEPARILRPDELRRNVFLQQPPHVLGGPAVRVHRAAGQRESGATREASGRVHQGRLAGEPRLSLGRRRYDWQNFFHDDNNVAPRVVVRVRASPVEDGRRSRRLGVFTDRSGPVILAEVLHSAAAATCIPYVMTKPTYPTRRSSPAPPSRHIPSWRRACRFRARCSTASSVDGPASERAHAVGRLHRRARATTCFGRAMSTLRRHRSMPARPDPDYGAIREVESTGRQSAIPCKLTLRGQMTRWFNGQTQYTLSRPERHERPDRIRRMTTTSPANGRERISIAGIACFCSGA